MSTTTDLSIGAIHAGCRWTVQEAEASRSVRWKKPGLARLAIILLGSFLFATPGVLAQVDVRGQIILPDGDLPNATIRFYLTSDDGRVNEIRYTDSNGRFILERLDNRISYTISVDSDGAKYGDSRYNFTPAYEQVVRMTLRPLPVKVIASTPTVSAASGYKPDPKAFAIYERALKEIGKKHQDAAERLLREAVVADPKYSAPLNDLGVLLMAKKNYEEAEKVLRQALENDPKSLHALLNLGITLNRMGRYADAIAPLREAVRLEPGLALAHQHLGIAFVETEQFAEAATELELAAKSPHVEKNMVELYLGKLYARTGDFDKSIAAFTIYLQNEPQSPQAGEVRALIARMQELKTKRN